MTIGILGGTFDPFHHGHLRMAIECHEKLQLQSLRLIPLHTPPHRQNPVASAEQRHAMLKLAIKGHDFLQVDDSELKRRGVSYTIDTIKHIRDEIAEDPLCLLLGSDAFDALTGWHEWQLLISYSHIVVVNRPGNTFHNHTADKPLAEFIQNYRTERVEDLHMQPAGSLFELDIPLLDISATHIRAIIKQGLDPSGLLPDNVIEYICTHSLYQQDKS